ncbi:MAG: hypothetical protein LBK99_27075 [Opitutaceae bacterium]|jgi:hypothetical protein|nr:hypothetical protein [Opitutaceae bacterium]
MKTSPVIPRLSLALTLTLASTGLFVIAPPLQAASAQTAPVRELKIAVAADAPAEIREAARRVLASVPAHPLLRELARENAPRQLLDTRSLAAEPVPARAYSHIVMIGLPDDPLVAAAWQREARPTRREGQEEAGGEKNADWYAFGYGNLSGVVGWVESDRNPFLHSDKIPTAPFETHIVTLSGNTPAGVVLAVDAFLKNGLLNGLVAAPGWKRGDRTLLDHAPLPPPPAAVPALASWAAPATAGDLRLVGWTQPNEEEYRGVEEDAGNPPLEIARYKYFASGEREYAGHKFARTAYILGLHRRAWGNTLWVARFATPARAEAAAARIAAAARLRAADKSLTWQGKAAPHNENGQNPDEPSLALELWSKGNLVFMSTLPPAATARLH